MSYLIKTCVAPYMRPVSIHIRCFFLLLETVLPVPTPLPAADHTALLPVRRWKLFKHKSSHQPGTHSLLGWESAHAGEVHVLFSNTAPHWRSRSSCPRPLRPNLQAIVTAPRRPACIWTIIQIITGTLTVITAKEHVALSGSFTPHTKSVRRHRHYVVMRATRDTQSPILKGESCISTRLSRKGSWTRAACVTAARSTRCAVAPSMCISHYVHLTLSTCLNG